MGTNRRTQFDIMASILRIVTTKGSKTAVMYKANLSYESTQLYLAKLHEAGLIEKSPSVKRGPYVYTPTEAGRRLLGLLETIEDMFRYKALILTVFCMSALAKFSYVFYDILDDYPFIPAVAMSAF